MSTTKLENLGMYAWIIELKKTKSGEGLFCVCLHKCVYAKNNWEGHRWGFNGTGNPLLPDFSSGSTDIHFGRNHKAESFFNIINFLFLFFKRLKK